MKLPAFIFSNKWPYRLLRHLTYWASRITFLEFAQLSRGGIQNLLDNLHHIKYTLLFAVTMVLATDVGFTYIIIYFLAPRYLLKGKYLLFAAYFIIDILFFQVIGTIYLYNYLTSFGIKIIDFPLLCWNNLIEFLQDGCVSACVVFLCLKLFKTWYLKQVEGQELAKANADAEMQILKAQVQPHFLFNTLNNIYSFTLNKSPKAEELVSNLYEIMKYMVNDCNVDLIELSKDLKMVEDYIELEKVRYGRRLDISVNIEGEYKNKMITPLLMIPFIENSFKHGTSKMLRDPWIKLFIQSDENVLHFTLANSKPANEVINVKGGIGLTNVKKRMELLYPQNHLLTIESTPNTFTVNMQVPLYKIDEKIVA